MLRMTCAAATLACALGASNSASAQSFSLSIGTRPYHGGYGYYAPGYSSYYGGPAIGYGYGYRQPHLDYHRYPFPHYDVHYGRHYHSQWGGYRGHGHQHHGGHQHHHGHHHHGGHRH